jgi:hypothetical protein
VKRLYGLTNKRTATKQIGARYHRMEAAGLAQRKALKQNPKFQQLSHTPPYDLDMNVRYYISKSRNHPIDIWSFLHSNKTDPSLKVLYSSINHVYGTSHVQVCNSQGFLPKLQDHILGRLLERPSQGDTYGDFSDAERNVIHILGNKLFEVNTMTVNYTSYDIPRDYDLINP